MSDMNPLSCNWLMIDGAKKILDEGDHTVNTINILLRYIKDNLHLDGVSIHQCIARPRSLRVMYEYIKNNPIRRINQTTTYSEEDWNHVLTQYKEGYYLYEGENSKAPLPGLAFDSATPFILQLPFFADDKFMGTLDLFDFTNQRYTDNRDITILTSLCNLIFEELLRLDTKNKNPLKTEDDSKDYITQLSRYDNFVENLDLVIPNYVTDENAILIVCSDIHHFKLVNETYGYRKGDELLRSYARHLSDGEPYIDACRVYSDNFIIAYSISKKDSDTAVKRIEDFHETLSLSLRESCPDNHIRICSGIYIIDDINTDASAAVAYANIARKRSKDEKGVQCVRFTPDMIRDIKWQAYLNKELPRAILNHQLMVYYQPKISCESNRLLGAEALIRWKKEDGSFIYPDQFIPIFEANGNIVKLDYFVYEEVFRYIKNRLDGDLPVVPVSMNVSRAHLESDDILAFIQFLLQKYQIPTKYIEFELTENIYMANYDSARNFIRVCNSMGISVSMDDFGSGYSSLNMISDLDIDILKIDKIFMRHEELSNNDKIVLSSVIDMAKKLNLIVLCEGVETESQAEFLKYAGCDIIQGYYYARPMCETEFDDFIIMDYIN